MTSPADTLRASAKHALNLLAAGDAPGAETVLRDITTQLPQHPLGWTLLGRVLRHSGRLAEAQEALQKAAALAPDAPQVLAECGYLALQTGSYATAYKFFKALCELKPDHPDAHYNLGVAARNLGAGEEALEALRHALAHDDGDPAEVWCEIGMTQLLARAEDEAQQAFEQALATQPRMARAHYGLGCVHAAFGRFDAALGAFRAALDLAPGLAEVYPQLAACKRFESFKDSDLAAMLARFDASSLPPLARERLGFALGKAHDDLGDYPQAFKFYSEANSLQRARVGAWDRDAHAALVDRLIDCWPRLATREPLAVVENSDRITPVFIVGLPRSGTTLVEQALARHPGIGGGGENVFIESFTRSALAPYPESLEHADQALLAGLAAGYRKRLAAVAPGVARVTDKYPANFLHLGLIRILFPDARIIHCRRNPRDTCLSLYFQDFPTGNLYAADLRDLAHYVVHYRRLMNFMRPVLGDTMFELDYETLVKDPEPVLKRALAHCGVAWDPACLNPAGAPAAVATQSRWEVRQPINAGSVGRWRNYAQELTPLFKALASLGVDT